MRRWLIRIGVLLAVVALGVVARNTVFKPKPLEVRAVEAARGTVEETVTNTRAGTVKARRRAQISPEIGGRAVDIPHREGDRVEKGDVLLRLDPTVLDAQLTNHDGGTRLTMRLHYGGRLWMPVLDRLLSDEIERSRPRLLARVDGA